MAAVSYADKGEAADSTSCILTMKVGPTKDLTKVPLQLSLTNCVNITCIQCFLATPDSTNTFAYGADKKIASERSDRWAGNHQAILAWNTKDHPNTLMAMVVSTMSEDFNGNDGPIITLYFDASKLSDGDYAIKLTDGNAVWTDKRKTKVYYSPDTEAPFTIKKGKLVVAKSKK